MYSLGTMGQNASVKYVWCYMLAVLTPFSCAHVSTNPPRLPSKRVLICNHPVSPLPCRFMDRLERIALNALPAALTASINNRTPSLPQRQTCGARFILHVFEGPADGDGNT